MFEYLDYLDRKLLFFINNEWRSPILDTVVPFLSATYWFWGILLGVALFWYFKKGGLKAFKPILPALILIALAVGTSELTCTLVKEVSDRARPEHKLEGVYHKRGREWRLSFSHVRTGTSNASFFSSHAANSMTLAVLVVCMMGWRRILIPVIPLVVGYSRVYLGRHYPLDVGAGFLAGICVASFYLWLYRKYSVQIAAYIEAFLLGLRDRRKGQKVENQISVPIPAYEQMDSLGSGGRDVPVEATMAASGLCESREGLRF